MPNPDTAEHKKTFGATEDADSTRQAQHTRSNDTPTDVNFNAIVARSQELTVETAGRNYEAGAARRSDLADIIMGKMGLSSAGV